SNRKIRSELKSQDKQVKYVILVAQLVYISTALNDGAITSLEKTGSDGTKYRDTLDKNYKITYTENGSDVTRTVERILEYDDSILPCDSPLPLENGYPAEVAEPTIPPEVTKPVLPQAPKVPAMPQEVDDPGEPPAVVLEPIKPTLVEAPGEEPPLYIPPAEKAALVEAYNKGIIINREEIDTPYTFTATQTVQKRFKNVESVTVFFYPDIDKAPYTVQVDKGTRADYEGELPTKSEDDRATYSFSHWVDKEGNRVDLSAVNEDVVLYPYFAETVKCYDITFIVDGNETVISLPYGAFPEYDGTPFRADDEYYEYTFSGWDKPLTEVTGDASYSACFGREYILAYSGGGAHITLSDGYYIADCASSMAKSFDLERLIKRATAQNVRAGIILRTNACELTISYSTLLQMQNNRDTVVSPSVVQNGIKGYKYSVAVLSSLGEEGGEYRMQAKMPCKLTEVNKLRLYDAADTSTHLTFTAEDGGIAFSLLSGRAYQLSIAYDINIIGSNMAQISADCEVAAPGSTISVSIDLPNGIMLDRIYLVYPDGAEHTVIGGKFKMPSFDVSLGVECSYIEYVIKFTDDTGRVLSTQYLKYGDTVAPPSAPVKASDSKYSYTFYGWSSPITDVDGDKVYKAVFTATRLPEKPTDTGLKISPGILRLLITGLVGICMLFLVVIPWSVITIVFVSLEKKRHIKAEGRSKE
ncbi:MAG: hypothetical protein IJY24_05190, partial [Clostridia bacterium]|nr:hypothetical protein [Clostridia bacterium]